MKQTVLLLCMFCLAACLVQSLLPQGKMKRTAVFACSLFFIVLFLESGLHLLQNIKLPILDQQWSSQRSSLSVTANTVYARQLVQSILGQDALCDVFYDEEGNIASIEVVCPQGQLSFAAKQSILQALCGIYGIEQTAIEFRSGR